jgi:hypothetical protein
MTFKSQKLFIFARCTPVFKNRHYLPCSIPSSLLYLIYELLFWPELSYNIILVESEGFTATAVNEMLSGYQPC